MAGAVVQEAARPVSMYVRTRSDGSSIDLWHDIATTIGDIAGAAGRHPVGLTQLGVVGCAAQFLAAHTLGGYYDGLVKRADRWLRGGEPVAGLGTFHGRVIAMRGQREAAIEGGVAQSEGSHRAVIETVRTQRHAGSDIWRDVHVTVHSEPFRLAL